MTALRVAQNESEGLRSEEWIAGVFVGPRCRREKNTGETGFGPRTLTHKNPGSRLVSLKLSKRKLDRRKAVVLVSWLGAYDGLRV